MTAIANWINKEMPAQPRIWTIGDTKIVDYSTNTNLSLESSKVFELQIRCINTSQHPEMQECYFEHSIGFAFAGSSLLGLNAFATLNTVFSNLGGQGNDKLPDMNSMAVIAAKIIDYYAKSICNLRTAFESVLYGYCPVNKKLERYTIGLSGSVGFVSVLVKNDEVLLLGDKKEEIMERINNEFSRQQGKLYQYWRAPLRIISETVLSGLYDTIGGGTQLNIADQYGCRPLYAAGERYDSDSRFRNIDIYEDIGREVGNCIIAIPGMYYKVNDSFD